MPSAIRVIDQLAELADVTLAGLADNDILQYDSVTSKWNNTAFASIGFVPYTGATANLDLGAFDFTTTGNITGNGITDNGLTVSLAVYTDGSKQLTSTAPTSGVIGYWSRTEAILTPTTSGDAIKVDEIYDTSGNISIAVDARFLQADDEAISVKYDDRILASGAGAVTSVDWDDRQLVASDGADVVLDWSTAGAADFINSNITTSGTLNSTSATAGQSIIASGLVVNNDGDGALADDFVAKTTSKANAFQVDASDDQINLNVVENYQWTMGTGSDDPTTDAPVDWIQIEIAGVVRYIPVYA